jgi:hypothetical protein
MFTSTGPTPCACTGLRFFGPAPKDTATPGLSQSPLALTSCIRLPSPSLPRGAALSAPALSAACAWHREMAQYLYSIDPYHHLVSTSFAARAGDPLGNEGPRSLGGPRRPRTDRADCRDDSDSSHTAVRKPSMTPRERVIRALRFEHPDRAPREVWALPASLLGQRTLVAAKRSVWAECRPAAGKADPPTDVLGPHRGVKPSTGDRSRRLR